MSVVLDRKYTNDDDTIDILKAINTLATDKNHRILMEDDNHWLETKLKEVGRLTRIIIRRKGEKI